MTALSFEGYLLVEKLIAENDELQRKLEDCRNELCLRCGRYNGGHDGACKGCRWHMEADGVYNLSEAELIASYHDAYNVAGRPVEQDEGGTE